VRQLDLLLKPKEAKALLASPRSKAMFGCRNTRCCPRGNTDLIENPGRHFLYQRIKEVGGLSQVPESLRPQRFLEQHLWPATDKALAAANLKWQTKSWPGELINTESALILCGLLSVSMRALPHPSRSPICRRHGPRETPGCDRRHGRTQIY